MKKILILNYEYPPLGGGAGVVSQKYAEGLSNLGHKVTVVTTWFEGEKEHDKKGDLEIIKLKSLRKKVFQSNPIEMLSWSYSAKKFLDGYLAKNHFEICIAFFSIPGGIVAKYIKKKFEIPYIVSTHGHDIPGFYPEKMRKFHILTNWYTKQVWNNADNILVLTSEMKKLADSFGTPKKNIILPNGCHGDFFSPDYSKKRKKFTLLFVGRLVDQKDPFTMLTAIKKLQKKNDNFLVNVVGDGPLKGKMKQYVIDNGLESHVNFCGWISKEELREYYQGSHIQICTSKVEAMSIAILESIYSGLYILSTPVSGNTDIIEENKTGNFFNIGSSENLVNILVSWAGNFHNLPQINNISLNGLRKKYSWTYIIQQLDILLTKYHEKK